jgi:hypothetical protein
MHLTGLDLLLWAASFIGHLILFAVLLLRRRYHLFPVFTLFVGMSIVRTIALFLIRDHGTKAEYFYSYWGLAILDVLIQLGIVYEMMSRVFRPLGNWAKGIKTNVMLWIAGSLVVASILTIFANPATSTSIQKVMIKGNFFTSALMGELFVGMLVLSARSGLPWNTYVARISQALGVYSIAELLVETGHTYFGMKQSDQIYIRLSHVRISIYLGCLIYWIIMLWRETPRAREMSDSMRVQLSGLHQGAIADVNSLRERGRR